MVRWVFIGIMRQDIGPESRNGGGGGYNFDTSKVEIDPRNF